jgi:nitrite reductase (NO-forming)
MFVSRLRLLDMRARLIALPTCLLLVVGITAGCVAHEPGWTYNPGGSNAPAPTASGPVTASNAVTTPEPTGHGDGGAGGQTASDDVVPTLTPKVQLGPVPSGETNVAYAPDVPPASTRMEQSIVDVHFDVVEGAQAIDPNGTQYTTWGYRLHGESTVTTGTPGPMIRARVGDILRFTLTNNGAMPHNVDFHAVTGQGGGAADTTVAPGETAVIEARLLYPGIFMYHCAEGDVPQHIVQGMYGGILVDPQTPLPSVEHELYMVQSEYYTTADVNGNLITDRAAVTSETPTHVVFNGAVGALTGDNAPTMQVGERMRIYFVNAGLNLDSNFHPIGSHWDKVWQEGALLNNPLRGSQTTLVPAGGGTVVELIAQLPQTIVLVDHALARAFDKGAIGQIVVTGDPNLEIYEGFPVPASSAAPMTPAETPAATPGEATPPASAVATPSSTGGTAFTVDIPAGAFNFQPDNAPDEFADTENPPDYAPNVLMVPLGATVTWTNNDPGMTHTVTAADGSFDSGMLAAGQSWSYTFDQPGDFDYICTPHPWMKGRVSVMMH